MSYNDVWRKIQDAAQNKKTQDTEAINAELLKKAKASMNAKALLENQTLQNFFMKKDALLFEAFKALPVNASIDDYREIHFSAIAIRTMQLDLQADINSYEMQTERIKNA